MFLQDKCLAKYNPFCLLFPDPNHCSFNFLVRMRRATCPSSLPPSQCQPKTLFISQTDKIFLLFNILKLNLSQYILKHIYIILSLDFENSQCSHLCPIVPTLLPMGHVTEVILSPPQGLATGSEGDLYHFFGQVQML